MGRREGHYSGRMLGSVSLSDRIGGGAMGEIYKGYHDVLEMDVAVKVILPGQGTNEEAIKRFIREARASTQLSHPNILKVLNADRFDGTYYIVMEYVDGTDLKVVIQRHKRVAWVQTVAIMEQSAAGLGHAHKKGIVHRDIKPDNLLMSRKGEIKVADFGLATLREEISGMTGDGQMMGTPLYMSPEQCEGVSADWRADIYSLGATWYHLLAGRAPYMGDSPAAVIAQHMVKDVAFPDDLFEGVPAPVIEMIRQMMMRDRDRRLQSLDEVVHFLEEMSNQSKIEQRATVRQVVNYTRRLDGTRDSATGMPVADSRISGAMPPANVRDSGGQWALNDVRSTGRTPRESDAAIARASGSLPRATRDDRQTDASMLVNGTTADPDVPSGSPVSSASDRDLGRAAAAAASASASHRGGADISSDSGLRPPRTSGFPRGDASSSGSGGNMFQTSSSSGGGGLTSSNSGTGSLPPSPKSNIAMRQGPPAGVSDSTNRFEPDPPTNNRGSQVPLLLAILALVLVIVAAAIFLLRPDFIFGSGDGPNENPGDVADVGTWIYFAHAESDRQADIYRVRASGGEPEQLTTANGLEQWPTPLAGGTRLAYISGIDTEGRLFVTDRAVKESPVTAATWVKLVRVNGPVAWLSDDANGRLALIGQNRTPYLISGSDPDSEAEPVLSSGEVLSFDVDLRTGSLLIEMQRDGRHQLFTYMISPPGEPVALPLQASDSARPLDSLGAPRISPAGDRIVCLRFAPEEPLTGAVGERSGELAILPRGGGKPLVLQLPHLRIYGRPIWLSENAVAVAAEDRTTNARNIYRIELPTPGQIPKAEALLPTSGGTVWNPRQLSIVTVPPAAQ